MKQEPEAVGDRCRSSRNRRKRSSSKHIFYALYCGHRSTEEDEIKKQLKGLPAQKPAANLNEKGERMDLQRTIFTTSRECEYFTDKELTAQIGHGQEYWPLAGVLRELIDNSLDACEMGDVAPQIDVSIQDDCLSVSDNGPGIPPEVITKSLNYMVRVSDKAGVGQPDSWPDRQCD